MPKKPPFFWLLRDSAVYAPHYFLAELANLDSRIDAHLDGLRTAGDAGMGNLQESLSWEEAGEVFAAAVLAFESRDEARIQAVLETGSASLELSRGLVSALGWLPSQQAEGHIKRLFAASSPDRRCIGIAACAVQRWSPGKPLIEVLSDRDPWLKAWALRAVGQLGQVDLLPLLQNNFAIRYTMPLFRRLVCRLAGRYKGYPSPPIHGRVRCPIQGRGCKDGATTHGPANSPWVAKGVSSKYKFYPLSGHRRRGNW